MSKKTLIFKSQIVTESGLSFLYPFLLTVFAGLSTGIGSTLAFLARGEKSRLLPLSLGLSAGVMIYISFMEIIPEARHGISQVHGEKTGYLWMIGAVFAGILISALIDYLVPESGNPHEVRDVYEMDHQSAAKKKPELLKIGFASAIAIAVHNFPEGIATFMVASQDLSLGFPMAIAVAIHNIPEGIAVAVPVYYATGDRKKAFWLSFLTGFSEPVGALLGYFFLMPILNEFIFSVTLGMTGGIMIFISLDELLPSARKYGEHHLTTYGLVAGMAVMALSLYLLM